MTIIQTMLLVLVAGIIGMLVVNKVIDKRCESEPNTELCAKRGAP